MSDQATIDIAKAPILAYNEKNWDAVPRTITADAVYDEVSTGRRMRGVSEVIDTWRGWAAAMSNSKGTIESAYVSGNTVIFEITWRGTHDGPLRMPAGDIPATGRQMEVRGCQVVEVAEGRVKEIRHYFDMATILTQLGVSAAAA
jgi:steroid delta-isomerase-like uncharacterized protein